MDQIITGTQPDVEEAGNLFVELWNLDQAHNGMSVTLRGDDDNWLDPTADIRLDEQDVSLNPNDDAAPRPLIQIHNASKLDRATYQAVKVLFDNYHVKNGDPEDDLGSNPQEDQEIKAFLDAVIATQVIERAREIANTRGLHPSGGQFSKSAFRELLKKQWFELFTNHFSSPNPDCSGFEHVFVGDYSGNTIGGHHFWWKFFLDQEVMAADSLGHKYLGPMGEDYRWLATFRMEWKPEPGVRLINPPQKGFFVGCSPELMLAYGTLGLLSEKKNDGAHPVIELEGGIFELTVHANTLPGTSDPDERRGDHIRTVFPKLRTFSLNESGPAVTVPQALAANIDDHVRVRGVITSAVNGEFGLELRDAASAPQSIAVKLPKTFREPFNPVLNSMSIGKRVEIHARRGTYTGIPGLVDVTHIEELANTD